MAIRRVYDTPGYRKARKRLRAQAGVCVHCGSPGNDVHPLEADHQPPLRLHHHVDGTGCCRLVKSCFRCGRKQGGVIATLGPRHPQLRSPSPAASPSTEHDAVGFDASDPIWDVAWLRELRDIPAEATWPRLMTAPHPQATGSYGPRLAAWCAVHGRPMRWWQQLVVTRLLEHDVDGELCWQNAVISTARQVGKSFTLRELCKWRLVAADDLAFDELVIVHIARKLAVAVEVQRPARRWARVLPDPVCKVSERPGEQQIERLDRDARWMVRAKNNVVSLTADLVVVDEAWDVDASDLEADVFPTTVARGGQVLLFSTAHRKATSLVLNHRNTLDVSVTDGALYLEWSAPPAAELDDENGWRMASPHWDKRRAALIAQRFAAARGGATDDPDEPDPFAAFSSQWLNRWPATKKARSNSEPLVGVDRWADLAGELAAPVKLAAVAIEDDRDTHRTGVAVVAADETGNIEVDGRLFDGWEEAFRKAREWSMLWPNCQLVAGASLRIPADFPNRDRFRIRLNAEAYRAVGLFREYVRTGRIHHSSKTTDLVSALTRTRVQASPAGAIQLLDVDRNGQRALAKAMLWALDAAAEPAPTPAIH